MDLKIMIKGFSNLVSTISNYMTLNKSFYLSEFLISLSVIQEKKNSYFPTWKMYWENCQKSLLTSLCPSNPVHIFPDTHSIAYEKSKFFLNISADSKMLTLSRTSSVSTSCPQCVFVLFFPSCYYGVNLNMKFIPFPWKHTSKMSASRHCMCTRIYQSG